MKRTTPFCTAVIIGSSVLSFAAVDRYYVGTKQFDIPGNYQPTDSVILGSASLKGYGGKDEKDYFDFNEGDTINKYGNKVVFIESWAHLQNIKKDIEAKLLTNIRSDDFAKYNFAVMIVYFGHMSFLENEKLFEKNGELFFSYDIWAVKSEVVSTGMHMKLFVLKLKKRRL